MCGGTLMTCLALCCGLGLSPRVRGNLHPGDGVLAVQGSIPACAGEPVWGRNYWRTKRVYPRVCGGTRSPMRTSI